MARVEKLIETLTGRLKWEQSRGNLCIDIPARLSAKKELYSLLLSAVWLFVVGYDISRWSFRAISKNRTPWPDGLDLIPLFLLLCSVFVILTSSRLLLSNDVLRLEYRVFGVGWRARQFPTRLLHNLRYSGRSGGMQAIWNASELRIDQDYRTVVLAVGLDATESTALIAKLMAEFHFPKYLPGESGAESQAASRDDSR